MDAAGIRSESFKEKLSEASMIAEVIVQGANLGFLIGIVFVAYYWFKAFQYMIKSNAAPPDWTSFGLSIFSSKYFTAEGNQYRKRFWLATLTALIMLIIPLAVRYFK